MPRVVHIVTTSGFAGVERYVCNVASATAVRGWDVVVVGGDGDRMRHALGGAVRWEPGHDVPSALRSILRTGRANVSHAHMTIAEAVAVATRPVHRAVVVSTRHFAARRGASRGGRVVAPWIARNIRREIANGEFVAQHLERPPAAVITAGVPASTLLWRPENRIVLVMQRLEAEKDTGTALRAWSASQLATDGWSMRIVGEGSERVWLDKWVRDAAVDGVTFAGWTEDVASELRRAGILFATATAEPLGLSVLEAMAAGVPVVASASGGHLETIGATAGARLFPPGDAAAGAMALDALRSESARVRLSSAERLVVSQRFTIERHIDRLLGQYEAACAASLFPLPNCAADPSQ
jgi:glycosyltransferase involved in cell wall biosynthesis